MTKRTGKEFENPGQGQKNTDGDGAPSPLHHWKDCSAGADQENYPACSANPFPAR
jgi:hypothetical protein